MPKLRLTPEDVQARVDAIRIVTHDPEDAHGLEDAIREDVLRAIADGSAGKHAKELARIALSTSEIKFARWYA